MSTSFCEPTLIPLLGVILPGSHVSLENQKTAGGYYCLNDDISPERFPLTLTAEERPLFTAWFQGVVTSEYVEKWASQNGYELALIDDLLAVGSHSEHKELQRQFPVLALGSSAFVGGYRRVPCLHRDSDSAKRALQLSWYGNDWSVFCRFLLVRKAS